MSDNPKGVFYLNFHSELSRYNLGVALATAIILSIKKHAELRRQLLYYANKPVHLVLADGSSDDWSSGNCGSIGEMTWEYFRISGPKTYLKRLAEASRRVQTEYVF